MRAFQFLPVVAILAADSNNLPADWSHAINSGNMLFYKVPKSQSFVRSGIAVREEYSFDCDSEAN